MATLLPGVLSLSAGAGTLLSVFTVASQRRAGVALAVAGLHQLAIVGYYLRWAPSYPFWAVWLWALTEHAALVAFGMYLRALPNPRG